jgi:hypothetical protein
MWTMAHSCLMRRKPMGDTQTTTATTELNESDNACDASVLAPSSNPVLDDADDKLRHSRVHLRPLLPTAVSVAFRPTSDMIHFPDCPIATGVSRCNRFFDPLLRRSFCGRWEGEENWRRRRGERDVTGWKEVVGEVAIVLCGHDEGWRKPSVVRVGIQISNGGEQQQPTKGGGSGR